jgi:hypothetical protein
MPSTNGHLPPPEPPPADPVGKPAAPEKPPLLRAWPIGCWLVTLGRTLLGALWSIFEATLLTAAVGLALVLGVAEWVMRLVRGKGVEKPQPKQPRKPS